MAGPGPPADRTSSLRLCPGALLPSPWTLCLLCTVPPLPRHAHCPPPLASSQVVHPHRGGVDPHIAARSSRSSNGSLVLGQAHDCPGGWWGVGCRVRGGVGWGGGKPRAPTTQQRAGLQHGTQCLWLQVSSWQRGAEGRFLLGTASLHAGGCFSPQYSLHGDMASLRVWDRVLSRRGWGGAE